MITSISFSLPLVSGSPSFHSRTRRTQPQTFQTPRGLGSVLGKQTRTTFWAGKSTSKENNTALLLSSAKAKWRHWVIGFLCLCSFPETSLPFSPLCPVWLVIREWLLWNLLWRAHSTSQEVPVLTPRCSDRRPTGGYVPIPQLWAGPPHDLLGWPQSGLQASLARRQRTAALSQSCSDTSPPPPPLPRPLCQSSLSVFFPTVVKITSSLSV